MLIGTNGLVVDEFGQALLIRRDDTRTLALPGGGLDIGELPPNGAVREVQEETGLLVMPVRLVGLYYWVHHPDYFLIFVFRCLKRGGTITTSEESPEVAFWPTTPFPNGMLHFHEQRLQDGISHRGGKPFFVRQPLLTSDRIGRFLLKHLIYPWKNWRRGAAPMPQPQWQAHIYLIIEDEAGNILWYQTGKTAQLPGGEAIVGEAPWETAVRYGQQQLKTAIEITGLTVVMLSHTRPTMTFIFTATTTTPATAPHITATPPDKIHPQTQAWLQWHQQNPTETTFHFET